MRPRGRISPVLFGLLLIVWLFLNGFSLGQFVLGAGLAGAVMMITRRYWLERAPQARPGALLAYCLMVLWDVVVANLQVARIVLFMPPDQIRSAWVVVPIDLPSSAARALLAATITMTPGTLTADYAADGSALLVHALHAPDPDAVCHAIKSRYEARVKRIFGHA